MKLTLTEDQILKQIQEWLTDCDADTLAKYTGLIFGGECFFMNGQYEFSPNSEYMGVFNSNVYKFIVDLNERGMFHAHVEDQNENTVYSISNENSVYDIETGEDTGLKEYGQLELVEDGFMSHAEDMQGLEKYLVDMGIIPAYSNLIMQG